MMRDGGVIAIVSQPRCPGATADHTTLAENDIKRRLEDAGFCAVRSERLDLDPPVVCVLGSTRRDRDLTEAD